MEAGKKYLELHPANDEEEMKDVVNAVYELEDQLKNLRKQLQELKGTVKCEVCGAECDGDDVFCRKCGAELKKPTFCLPTAPMKPTLQNVSPCSYPAVCRLC